MLIPILAQKALALGGIAGDGTHIWDEDLQAIDEILLDEGFIDILFDSSQRRAKRPTGRLRLSLNRLLRLGALKHIKDWSFRDLANELERNLDYRAFTQFFDDKTRSVSALCRNLASVDGQTVRALNERLCEVAVEEGLISGKSYRQDSTVCETDVHHPTDSSLLQDGVRVLQRTVQKAEKLLPSLGRMRERTTAVKHRVLEIARASRGRGEAAKERRNKSYESLLRIVRPVVTGASKVTRKLDDGRVTRRLSEMNKAVAERLKQQLDTMLPRVEQVISQTRARVIRGNNCYPDKLLSLFEPLTAVIRKGKQHKPNEFGRVVDIVEVEHGFVSDYQVLDGNPSDSSLLIPALERHMRRFGQPPCLATTDRGYWSAQNESDAYALGVKRVAIPIRGKLSAARLRLQRSRWFRQAQRWRANGEGRIATLKNAYGMKRCMYKGEEAMERWVGWCVFANNLMVLARLMRKRKHDQDSTEGQGARAAARAGAPNAVRLGVRDIPDMRQPELPLPQ
jgi:IS5 family transposase